MFRAKTKPRPDPDVVARLQALEARQTALEKEWKAVEVEWTEWFDKYRRLYGRIAKRAQREDAPESQNGPQGGSRLGVVTNPAAQALLYGRRR